MPDASRRPQAVSRRHCPAVLAALGCLLVAGLAGVAPAGAAPPPTSSGPQSAYRCSFNVNTSAFTGADGTASAIGWLGDHNSVITCLGGTFVIQDGPGGYFVNYGFGIYDGQHMTWSDADGYLPAQVTAFGSGGADVTITEFADEVTLGGDPFVAVYSRVRVVNPTAHALTVDPGASAALVPLDSAPDSVPAHGAVDHDYVIVSDRFGASYPWPDNAAIAGAGGFDQHFARMRAFWDAQLGGIAQISVPDAQLVDAYKAGFITTQLTRSGDALDTGVNGYESEFSHDVVGILTNLFTQGSFADAHALLTEARNVVGGQGQYAGGFYVDGLWTYPVPWAVYLMKTGDRAFVEQNFATDGPEGAAQPSIEAAAHTIAADRTGPMGTMEATDDIDTQGYWTTDDFEALLGLAAYRYLATSLGDTAEAAWASSEYDSLLTATDTMLGQTIATNHLDYLPCSLVQPNTANRCADPKDANWTSPFAFGSWAWEGYLLGATVDGPGLSMIDATYAYGFGRLRGVLPPGTTGGFPGDYYSSAYDAAQGAAGLIERAPPGPGHRRLRVHAGQRPERPAVVVGEFQRARPGVAVGGPPPGQRPGLVAARLGHGGSQQGAARLTGGGAGRRATGRRPRGARLVAGPDPHCGGQLPHHGRPPGRLHHLLERYDGEPDAQRGPAGGRGPVRSAVLRRTHRVGLGRLGRPGHGHGHPGPRRPPRHRHPQELRAPGSATRRIWSFWPMRAGSADP